MKHFSIIACFALLLFSCGKIDPSDYLIIDGLTMQWYDGDGVDDKSQRTLIEKYTGVRCINCPTADIAINNAMNSYGDKLIAVAIHDSSVFCQPIGNSPDLRTADGNSWSSFFGVAKTGQYPSAIVNRRQVDNKWDFFTPTSGIENHVDPILGNNPTMAIGVAASHREDSVDITVNIEYLVESSDQYTITLLIMEDGINATQRQQDGSDDTEYIHNHVLRDVITDIWGNLVRDGRTTEQIEANAPVAAGTKRKSQCVYPVANSGWDINNCHIVAFVSNKDTKTIVNVAECKIE